MEISEVCILGERVYRLIVDDETVLYFRRLANAQRVKDIVNRDWISEIPDVEL